jgi:hypothetical protein
MDSAATDLRQRAIEQEKQRKEQLKVVQDDMLKRLYSFKLSAKDIDNSPLDPFGEGSKAEFHRMLKTQIDGETGENRKDDTGLVQRLFDDIHRPDGDPRKIVDADQLNQHYGRGVNKPATLGWLRGEVALRGTPEGQAESDLKKGVMDVARAALVNANKFTGIMDPNDAVGREQMQKFTSFFEQQYQAGKKAGRTPEQMLDPGSKDYLGKYIQQFTISMDEAARNAANAARVKPAGPISPPSWARLPNSVLTDTQTWKPISKPAPGTFDTTKAAGLKIPGNTDPWNRPALQNPDGSYSTTSSISIGTDKGETLIPTVVDGKRLSNDDAIARFQKTGQHLGIFDTVAHADAYATALHNAQAARLDDHGKPLKPSGPPKRNPGETPEQFLNRLGAGP